MPQVDSSPLHHQGSPPSEFTLGVVRSVYFGKCMMTRIYHENLTQNNITALKILFAPLLPPQHLTTIDLFTISTGLSFPECHIAGITQYVSFAD